MFFNTKTKVFDGDDYQIIFSDSFNIYENKLKITDVAGYDFEFIFDKGKFSKDSGSVFSKADENSKTVTVTLKNFRNQLGTGSTEKTPVIELSDGRKIFFSIYGKSLSDNTDFLHININFYLK